MVTVLLKHFNFYIYIYISSFMGQTQKMTGPSKKNTW